MSTVFSVNQTKTSLEKIVDKLIATEGKVTIITGEYSPVGILISLFERVSGVEVYNLKTAEERTAQIEKYKDDIEALSVVSNGDSKFTCFRVDGHKPEEVIREIQKYLAETKATEIVTQPDNILFRHCSNLELEEWNMYKLYLNDAGVKLVEVEDDLALKVIKNRGVKH